MKRSRRKKLVDELDKIYSVYIRLRDKRCVTCGSTANLTNGHLHSRASYSTRWHERNCHAQCKGCNLRHEYASGPFNSFFLGKFGQEAWEDLYREYRTTRQFKDWQLQEMIAATKQKVEELTK